MDVRFRFPVSENNRVPNIPAKSVGKHLKLKSVTDKHTVTRTSIIIIGCTVSMNMENYIDDLKTSTERAYLCFPALSYSIRTSKVSCRW